MLREELKVGITKIPEAVTETILKKIEINGVVPVQRDDIKELEQRLNESIQELSRRIEQMFQYRRSTGGCDRSAGMTSESSGGGGSGHDMTWGVGTDSSIQGDLFKWDTGEICMVPQNYDFVQKVDCKNLCQRWHCGEQFVENGIAKKICPLKKLKPEFIRKKRMRQNFCKARKVMEKLEHMARDKGGLEGQEKVTVENYQNCFDTAYKKLIEKIYGDDSWKKENEKKKYESLSYITVYKYIRRPPAEANDIDSSDRIHDERSGEALRRTHEERMNEEQVNPLEGVIATSNPSQSSTLA
mmetsp:Transcript_48693/g.152850  ORF Transcript_48693/g.152850 Transcript_48693/m.152850 type:complete len:299 (-) Transcript_48693:408-1304(-)